MICGMFQDLGLLFITTNAKLLKTNHDCFAWEYPVHFMFVRFCDDCFVGSDIHDSCCRWLLKVFPKWKLKRQLGSLARSWQTLPTLGELLLTLNTRHGNPWQGLENAFGNKPWQDAKTACFEYFFRLLLANAFPRFLRLSSARRAHVLCLAPLPGCQGVLGRFPKKYIQLLLIWFSPWMPNLRLDSWYSSNFLVPIVFFVYFFHCAALL